MLLKKKKKLINVRVCLNSTYCIKIEMERNGSDMQEAQNGPKKKKRRWKYNFTPLILTNLPTHLDCPNK